MVIAMIAAITANERLSFLLNKMVFTGERRGKARKTSPLFEIARLLHRLDRVTRIIVNANYSIV